MKLQQIGTCEVEKEKKADKRPVTHVIFDLDGTLLDTESIYNLAYRKVCESHGCLAKLTSTLEAKLTGLSAMQVARTLQSECGMDISPAALRAELDREIKPYLSKASLKPGARRLIRHLADHGIPLALATSSRKMNAQVKMSGYPDVFSHFSHMVFRDDVSSGKPSPDIFVEALARFHDQDVISPDGVLVFEDSLAGVRAAQQAGLQVVMVPENEEYSRETFLSPLTIIESLACFCPENFGLPSFHTKIKL